MRKIFLIIAYCLMLTAITIAQTSRFQRNFTKTDGTALTGFTNYIFLVPQANTYPTGALALTEDGTRPGVYYRINVADGEYKIYIDADKGGANPPTVFIENYWLGEQRLSVIANHFDAADQYRLFSDGIKNGAVTSPKIADNAITANKINDASVTNSKIFDLSITTQKIDWSAVTSGKIADANVTLPKLSQAVIDFINSAGGGTITNLPDDVTLDTKLTDPQTIGIKDDWLAIERVRQDVVMIEDYIGVRDTSAGWSLIIQDAVDANLGTGKRLKFKTNKVYELQRQKVNPYNGLTSCCVDMKTGGIILEIPFGTTLKMKNGQQTDATGGVDLITFQDASNIYIGGGGKIVGNTAGQSGWTQGYMQLSGGCLIRGYSSAGDEWGLGSNIIIENLDLNDHFSNPVDISSVSKLMMRNLRCHAVGEGFGASYCDDVLFDNVMVNDSTGTFAGDAIEVVRCFDFKLVNCTVEQDRDGTGATAFDLGGSWNGIVDNFNIKNWTGGGFSFGTSFGIPCRDIIIQNGKYTNDEAPANSAIAFESGEGEITFRNNLVRNVGQGFVFLNLGENIVGGLQTVDNCTFINTSNAVYSERKAYINNCIFDSCGNNTNNSGAALTIAAWNNNDATNVTVTDSKFYNSDFAGIACDVNGKSGFTPSGVISGNLFHNTYGIEIAQVANATITFLNNKVTKPQIVSGSGDIGLRSPGVDLELYVYANYSISSFSNYSNNQKVTIKYDYAPGNYTTLYDKTENGSGNIELLGQLNRIMNSGDAITLQYDSSSATFKEISFTGSVGVQSIVVDGWWMNDVQANLGATALTRSGGWSGRIYVTKPCYIRGVGVSSNENRTAGTLTVYVAKNGGGTITAVLNGTDTNYKFTRYGRYAGYSCVAGDYLDITVVTTADWTPTTADIIAWFELEY